MQYNMPELTAAAINLPFYADLFSAAGLNKL